MKPTTALVPLHRPERRQRQRSTLRARPALDIDRPLVPVFTPRNQREAALHLNALAAAREAQELKDREAVLLRCLAEIVALREELAVTRRALAEAREQRRSGSLEG